MTQLEKVQLTPTIKVEVTQIVLNKIQHLCKKIAQVEWSGILLYTYKGSIKKPEDFVITLKDIILMNKGSQVYTEYSFNELKRDNSGYEDRHIDYTNDNEEALTWSMGHKMYVTNT